jgi:hypothetical protein
MLWIHEIKHHDFRLLARRGASGVRLLTRHGHNLLLTSVAALLMAMSAAHARPELSKTESWKLTLATWCVGDHPSDNEAFVGIARDQCGENEATLIIGENGYTWEREKGLSCRYSSGKARFDNTIPASTKTVGAWVFHIVAGCITKPSEGAGRKSTQSFDMYVSKGTLWIENLRSDNVSECKANNQSDYNFHGESLRRQAACYP